eukprot:1159659-Pelagomonas_calceolata.AAC.2
MVLLTEQIIRGKTRLDRLDEVKNRECLLPTFFKGGVGRRFFGPTAPTSACCSSLIFLHFALAIEDVHQAPEFMMACTTASLSGPQSKALKCQATSSQPNPIIQPAAIDSLQSTYGAKT